MKTLLKWSDPSKPNKDCSYNHTFAYTPFGRFLLTWKSWKGDPDYGFDETPWGEVEYLGWSSVEEAQLWAEREMLRYITKYLTGVGIPRNIHQIWCGPSLIPERERVWCAQTAKLNKEWKHTLHGNELFARYGGDPYIKAMLGKGEKTAFVIDRLRILLLRDEGGVYVDVDAEPVKPLDSLPIWDMPHVDFVAGLRSPSRKDVALHRAVPIVDNTFLASAKGGRMVQHIEALWTPTAITGENHAINGHRVGIAVLEHASYDTILLNHRFIYCETQYPESLILHDAHNLGSWTNNPGAPRTCRV